MAPKTQMTWRVKHPNEQPADDLVDGEVVYRLVGGLRWQATVGVTVDAVRYVFSDGVPTDVAPEHYGAVTAALNALRDTASVSSGDPEV